MMQNYNSGSLFCDNISGIGRRSGPIKCEGNGGRYFARA